MKSKDKCGVTVQNQLLARLIIKARADDLSMRQLADVIDMSYPYFMSLVNCHRPVERMSREHFVACSNYLKISVAQAYLLSGALKSADFIIKESAEEKLENVLSALRSDKEWTGFVPNHRELNKATDATRILIAMLYERLAGTTTLADVEVVL